MGAQCAHHAIFPSLKGDSASTADLLLDNNARYAANFYRGDLPMPPDRTVAVLARMDAWIVVSRILGLAEGDAHVIRNAAVAVAA